MDRRSRPALALGLAAPVLCSLFGLGALLLGVNTVAHSAALMQLVRRAPEFLYLITMHDQWPELHQHLCNVLALVFI